MTVHRYVPNEPARRYEPAARCQGRKSHTFPSACNYGTTIFMKRSIKVAPKMRRGRPPSGGRDPHITIRMPAALIAEADAWGVANDTGRSEAIRRLVELGLKAK